jgi:hypothetical protein
MAIVPEPGTLNSFQHGFSPERSSVDFSPSMNDIATQETMRF